ncbi:MAG: hypothetical protein R6U70_09510 [Bacillota bacterium]
MSSLRPWIYALLLTMLLSAILLPLEDLLAPGWGAVIGGQQWTQWSLVLLYLVLVIAAAWLVSIIYHRLLQGTGAWTRLLRLTAGWFSMTGLSPLQPALATVIILALFSAMLVRGMEPAVSPTGLVAATTAFLFCLALGAEIALRKLDEAGNPLNHFRSVISEMSTPLAGRLVMMLTSAAMFAALARWQPPIYRLISAPNGRDLIVQAVGMVAIAFVLSLALTHSKPQKEEAAPRPASGGSVRLAWVLVVCALLLPLLGTLISADPLRQSLNLRLTEAEGLLGSWGTDVLGRDLRARLFSAWWNTNLHAVLSAIVALVIALPLHAARCRGCGICTSLTTVVDRVPPPVLFLAGWGMTWGLTGPNFTTVAAGVGVALFPTALRLLVHRRHALATMAVLALSGMLLILGWELALGMVGFVAPPDPSFGTIVGDARGVLGAAPWLIAYSAGLFIFAAVLGVSALHAVTKAYGLPRSTTLLRG